MALGHGTVIALLSVFTCTRLALCRQVQEVLQRSRAKERQFLPDDDERAPNLLKENSSDENDVVAGSAVSAAE